MIQRRFVDCHELQVGPGLGEAILEEGDGSLQWYRGRHFLFRVSRPEEQVGADNTGSYHCQQPDHNQDKIKAPARAEKSNYCKQSHNENVMMY